VEHTRLICVFRKQKDYWVLFFKLVSGRDIRRLLGSLDWQGQGLRATTGVQISNYSQLLGVGYGQDRENGFLGAEYMGFQGIK